MLTSNGRGCLNAGGECKEFAENPWEDNSIYASCGD